MLVKINLPHKNQFILTKSYVGKLNTICHLSLQEMRGRQAGGAKQNRTGTPTPPHPIDMIYNRDT